MNLFYQPDISPESVPCTATLDTEESYHCIKVLRLRIGSQIQVTDGKGNLYDATVSGEDSKRCIVTLNSAIHIEKRPFHLHMAVAPTKSIDRFEWFLEKATEIGINEITPLICEHSERTTVRMDRLQKILVSAMKQSLNLHLPRLNEPLKFRDIMNASFKGEKFIGYVEEKQEIMLKNAYTAGSDALILIGPEGDFSTEEVEKAVQNGYAAISLGNSRLRTETAALVACHTINLKND